MDSPLEMYSKCVLGYQPNPEIGWKMADGWQLLFQALDSQTKAELFLLRHAVRHTAIMAELNQMGLC